MRRFLWIPFLLLASAAVALTPSRYISLDMPLKEKNVAGMSYLRIAKDWSHLAQSTEMPNQAFFQNQCKAAVLKTLKSPASAKFSRPDATTYDLRGRYYTTSGAVDSLNNYGTSVRRDYICFSAFEGTKKGGKVYFMANLLDDQ